MCMCQNLLDLFFVLVFDLVQIKQIEKYFIIKRTFNIQNFSLMSLCYTSHILCSDFPEVNPRIARFTKMKLEINR